MGITRIIAPSVLSADFGNLKQSCELINRSAAEWLHVDVLDGVFVPNMSFSFPIIEVLKKYCHKPLDVHLMIVEPEKYLERYIEAGADILTVHYEAVKNPIHTLNSIRTLGVKAGIAINPDIPVESLRGLIRYSDMVLLMSVFAGFGGQKFIEDTWERIDELKKLIEEENPGCLIEIDGGINRDNAPRLFEQGAHVLVAGSAVYNSSDPLEEIRVMLD